MLVGWVGDILLVFFLLEEWHRVIYGWVFILLSCWVGVLGQVGGEHVSLVGV